VAVGPALYLERKKQERVVAIEEQLDGFILALANALKATPSLGDAFASVQRLVPPPLSLEVELAVKEMRLGSTLDQALLFMAGRIGSRQVDSALSSVLIGRQIGGNLPKILDSTAGSLREMARLEGVVRTKTAEGRAQLWVLAITPGVLILAFDAVKDGYFDPLTESATGFVIIVIGVGLWLASIVTARRILDVDI
jgi:tight adherence protein B